MPAKGGAVRGQRFGRWTVLEPGRYLTHGSNRQAAAECRCDCGTVRVVRLYEMRAGTSLSCGCLRKPAITPGQRFGRWTVVDPECRLGPEGWRAGVRAAECRCDCGTARLVSLSTLTSGVSQSCGCLAREQRRARGRVQGAAQFRSAENRAAVSAASRTHGLSGHPLYGTWNRMRQRCENPRTKDYPRYGGRGIAVCAEWQDVTAFITWIEANIGPRPAGRTLDRIDNDGHYEPGNVRWATGKEQQANRQKPESVRAA